MNPFITITDSFYKDSKKLRQVFDDRFRDPHSLNSDRFIWDYWYVKNQYRLHRTPADYFFGKKAYLDFVKALTLWGRTHLGCQSISQPWLSYYVDGCFQGLHSDSPHGPWAFVYSLTLDPKNFDGGETFILKPETLSYWHSFSDVRGKELPDILNRISPKFNRLITFDPRFPHGVTPVIGPYDPREARLVIHGWFTEPKPFILGALTVKKVRPSLDKIANLIFSLFPSRELTGILTFRMDILASGKIKKFEILTQNLVARSGIKIPLGDIRKNLNRALSRIQFPYALGSSQITMPIIFT